MRQLKLECPMLKAVSYLQQNKSSGSFNPRWHLLSASPPCFSTHKNSSTIQLPLTSCSCSFVYGLFSFISRCQKLRNSLSRTAARGLSLPLPNPPHPPTPAHSTPPQPSQNSQPQDPFPVISKLPLSDLHWSSGTAVHDKLARNKKEK